MSEIEQDEAQPSEKKDAMASISGHISVLSTGDHAQLRRMYLTGRPAADGVVVKLLHHAGLQQRDYARDYAAWKLIVHVAALLSGTGKSQPHDRRKGFGAALHESGISEARLLRITAARGDPLQDQLVLAGRRIAQAGKGPVNLWHLLDLVRSNQKEAEKVRIRIARDYYAAAAARA